jgi:hypothetical protein
MTRFRNVVLKAGAVLIRGDRRLWFDLAEGMAPLWPALPSRLRRRRNAERPAVPKRCKSPLSMMGFTEQAYGRNVLVRFRRGTGRGDRSA